MMITIMMMMAVVVMHTTNAWHFKDYMKVIKSVGSAGSVPTFEKKGNGAFLHSCTSITPRAFAVAAIGAMPI